MSLPASRVLITLLCLSILIFNFYTFFVLHSYVALYPVLWLGGFGLIFLHYRARIEACIKKFPHSPFIKFILLGYGAVLLEEAIAAFVHALTEGFTFQGYTLLLFQFWAFNLLAFTGFIFGWYVLLRRFQYTKSDIFLLAGGWGLFTEHIFSSIFRSPIGALLLILPTMYTYNLILLPALLSLPDEQKKNISTTKKDLLTIGALLFFSIIPVFILTALRTKFPEAFPPCAYIPC